jgi:hypothetical protein
MTVPHTAEPLLNVGVTGGGSGAEGCAATLAALEQLLPVRFHDDAAERHLDAEIVLGCAPRATRGRPLLALAGRDARARPLAAEIALTEEAGVPPPLRGHTLSEQRAGAELDADDRAAVLAGNGRRPAWLSEAAADGERVVRCAYPLAALAPGESLRDHLQPGRFMGLLPTLAFLQDLLGAGGWVLPPLQACFVVDDPNLHWPSYGHLNYEQLVAHARSNGYHLAFATVPLDGWRADRRVTALLADSREQLSLIVHGNDHIAEELGRLDTDARAVPALAQALRRVCALERRSGVSVDRIVAPPHGACSEAALRAMFRLGYDAACVSRPYPWRSREPAPIPLAGWFPAELVAGGLPVLPRLHLGHTRAELALRATLGQPLILYGHHGDFAEGLDVLAGAAADVARVGPARWERLGRIARRSFCTRRVGPALLVRMHAREIELQVPQHVSNVEVHLPEPLGGAGGHVLEHRGGAAEVVYSQGLGRSEPIPVRPGERLRLRLLADHPLDATRVPPPRRRLWPLVRRGLVEGRDRLQGLR